MAKVIERKRTIDLAEVGKRALPWFGIVLFLVIWEIAVIFWKLPAYLLPKPTLIWSTILDNLNLLYIHSLVTGQEMILGYLLAIAVAVPLAIMITASSSFDHFITPILLFFQTVPKIAIAPLFLVWFGVGILPKVLVAFLISFFQLTCMNPVP